jgi:hypothetical protein
MFKIDSTLLPSWVQQTKNNTIAELGLPLSLTKYPKIPADRYEGPVDDYNRFVATEDNCPWLIPIPGFTNAEGKQLAFRSCCDFISTNTIGKEWHATTETITDEIISDKKGRLTLASGAVLRTNATMVMFALTGSGGGGAGGAMANSGPGGGGAATAVFIADTTKFTKIRFTLPMGGQGGPAGIANSNWNGANGDSGRVEFWDGDNYMFALVVDGGIHGTHLVNTSRLPGSGGQ